MSSTGARLAASFRDPSGFVFSQNGQLYRQVNQAYRQEYDQLVSSHMLEKLLARGLMVAHEEVSIDPPEPEICYKVLKPVVVPFISYPYEWSFSQLKDAALLTLEVQQEAVSAGMSLKDCSAYNVQFLGGKPIFIDTLSFETYEKGAPWTPYKQFCEHFLAPLALMARTDIRLSQLLRTNIDGVPLGLASRLLPGRTKFGLSLGAHIHLHSRSLEKHAGDRKATTVRLSKFKFLALLDSLRSAVASLRWRAESTEWSDYYEDTNYTAAGLRHKVQVVGEFLAGVSPRVVWDFGANTGFFSRLANRQGALAIAFDIDPACVEQNYLAVKVDRSETLLPLLMDLANPSPAIGWQNQERMSLWERGPTDAGLALALIHHLAISQNLPLADIARCFGSVCKTLVIEFVPKEDSQAQRLLVSRKDIFDTYNQTAFEVAFDRFFSFERREKILDSVRTLYLLKNKSTLQDSRPESTT